MKLKDALEKIAALEKRIEELEKRPQTVINNYPTPAAEPQYVPLPYKVYPQPYNLWHDTIITCGSIAGTQAEGISQTVFQQSRS